jgi:hypothetical protein
MTPVVRVTAVLFGTAVVVLAVIGAISVIDDPPWSDDEGSPAVLRDYQPNIYRASEAAKTMAGLQARPGDRSVEYANCVLGPGVVQPFRYICDVRYGPPRRRQFHIVQRIGTEFFELERDIPWSQRERP